MAARQLRGPAELVLAALIARRYYVDGLTKSDIADEFQLSRFKVARLLDNARDQGLVKIEISYPGAIDVALSAELRDGWHLQHAVVIADKDDDGSLRKDLGRAAAELLSEIITPNDVLGLAWARTVRAMVTELRQLPAIPVVQLTGALLSASETSSTDDDSSIDVVREVARIAGGPAYFFLAPFLLPNASAAQTVRRQPDVTRTLHKIDSVTKAVTGVGGWTSGQSTLFDASSDPERQGMLRQGVCAEVGGVFLTSDGRPLQTCLNKRMVSISAAQMEGVPEVIAIAYGVNKLPAVVAALRSGLLNSLVTQTSLATALLSEAGPSEQRGGEHRGRKPPR